MLKQILDQQSTEIYLISGMQISSKMDALDKKAESKFSYPVAILLVSPKMAEIEQLSEN